MNKDKINYPIFKQRLSQETIDWLNNEKKNYQTYNKFFNELIKCYKKKHKIYESLQ